MSDKITDRQIISCLEENDIPYGILPLQDGVFSIITQRGGRVLGPFLEQGGESVLWANDAFADPGAFAQFLADGEWNLGGERVWIAPEVQYGIRDRTDFWGTYHLPEQMDPGHHVLEQIRPDEWRLSQDLTLEAYNIASGRKELHLERSIRRVENPLSALDACPELMEGVLFAGWEQVVTLREGKRDAIMSEAWDLVQLNPGGVLLIPASPRVAYADYFEPIDESLQTVHADHVRLRITGDRRYKVGYKAAHTFGRLGYFAHLDDGRAYLVARNYFNNPSRPYVEEPPGQPGSRGCSIHVYNDGGLLGGFGELEVNCQTIGGETGRSSSTDQLVLWLYVGPEDGVKEIALHLLGIEI